MPDHLEAAGHVIERLGDVFADPPQRTAAGWTGAGVRHEVRPHAATVPVAGVAPASVLRPRSRLRLLRLARQSRAARPDRPPMPRSPTRAARPHGPASPKNARTPPGDSERAGSAAWRSRLEPRSHPAPSPR